MAQLTTAALRNRRLSAVAAAAATRIPPCITPANTTQIEFKAGRLPAEHPQTELSNSKTSEPWVCKGSHSIKDLISRAQDVIGGLLPDTAELAIKMSGTLFAHVQNNPDLQVSAGMYGQVCKLVIW